MAIDFEKFNQMFPANKLNADMKDAKENSGSTLPDGEYTVKLDKLELGESSKGAAMIKSQFRIIKGEYSKQCIFKNCVLTGTKNDGFMMLKGKEFLESLDSGIDVEFKDWQQYSDLIDDIFEAIKEDNLKYVVVLDTDGKYQNAEIDDIIE